MSLEEVVDSYTPRRRTVEVCPRNDLLNEIERLERQVAEQNASPGGSINDGPSQERQRLQEARREAAEANVEFVVESLPAGQWSDLVGQHPPDDDSQRRWDEETFPPAAVAACLVEPRPESDDKTRELVDRMFTTWHKAETDKLFSAVVMANLQADSVPKWWNGSAGTDGSDVR